MAVAVVCGGIRLDANFQTLPAQTSPASQLGTYGVGYLRFNQWGIDLYLGDDAHGPFPLASPATTSCFLSTLGFSSFNRTHGVYLFTPGRTL